MKKVLRLGKYAAVGVLLGGIWAHNKDAIFEHPLYFIKKPTHKADLLKTSSLFASNPNFLGENLKEFLLVSLNEKEAQFEYIPKISTQGHATVSHGGFTGCMAEYCARYFLHENKLDWDLSHFYIRYTKPMFVNNFYRVIIRKSEKDEGRVDFEIWDSAQNYRYCLGHLTIKQKLPRIK